jgi:exonuclease III
MITLSWNCRGLAQASTIRSLRALIRKHNPDILFFSETKALPSVSTPILRQLGFSLMVHAPPSGSKGGLLLTWRTDVNIVSFYVSCNIICV